jgi:hypothetical protein
MMAHNVAALFVPGLTTRWVGKGIFKADIMGESRKEHLARPSLS